MNSVFFRWMDWRHRWCVREGRDMFRKVFEHSPRGNYHGVERVYNLITNPILNEIRVYTFSICGGYFNPPISLTRSIISITRIVSEIGNISLSVFPSPPSQPYPSWATYGLLVLSHQPASAFPFLESRTRASLAWCLPQTSESYIRLGDIYRAGLSTWPLFRRS